MNRAQVESLPCRGAVGFAIEFAGEQDGQFRVRGVANSFGVMRSGRILHPEPFKKWAGGKGRTLAMLANHGVDVQGFASVGVWDTFAYDDRGMIVGGFVASGTQLAEDTRRLMGQKVLRTLSLGWSSRQARWVSTKDKDLDPWFMQKMMDAGVDEAYAFMDYEPIEASPVDVPDDPNAMLLAARHGLEAHTTIAAIEALRGEVRALVERLNEGEKGGKGEEGQSSSSVPSASSADTPELRRVINELWQAGENRLIESLAGVLSDPRGDYAAELLSQSDGESTHACGHAAPVTEAPVSGLAADLRRAMERIRNW